MAFYPLIPLELRSLIVLNFKHVFVQANVVDPLTGAEQKTNDFRFTWCDDGGEPLQRVVVPQTYAGTRKRFILRFISLPNRALRIDEMDRGSSGARDGFAHSWIAEIGALVKFIHNLWYDILIRKRTDGCNTDKNANLNKRVSYHNLSDDCWHY